MFVVDPAATDAIHQAFNEDGELAAIVELRRHFPLLTDNEHAQTCVHAIAGWRPVVTPLTTQLAKDLICASRVRLSRRQIVSPHVRTAEGELLPVRLEPQGWRFERLLSRLRACPAYFRKGPCSSIV